MPEPLYNPHQHGPESESEPEPVPTPAAGPGRAPSGRSRRRRRGIYLLPNLFTTAALFAGFYAVLSANAGRYEAAALAIFAAMLLDGFDGRIARMTNTQTDFGAEFDSLSDMVAFGVAPALVAYEWALGGLGKLGWLAAFVYTAGAALRLARFNTQIGIADKRYFQGLPSPAAAAIIAASVWIGVDNGIAGASVSLLVALFAAGAGLLMVSNFRYQSFKLLDLNGQVPFMVMVVVMLGFALVVLDPPIVLFLLFLAYALSGPVLTLVQRRRRRGRRRREPAAGRS
ncbi:MAG: CDP-diacylglycerol--serine O-phosphatidyltransferase [Gammaproteobacteria bacterium]|nr:CDP-diacylglycerol--serine O-phosphatidyltransferase [Gammaproteobacteria bacterium]